MDVSGIISKISNIKNLRDLQAYEKQVTQLFTQSSGSLNSQLQTIEQLLVPDTVQFVAKFIAMLTGIVTQLQAQINDMTTGLSQVNSAFSNQTNIINNQNTQSA